MCEEEKQILTKEFWFLHCNVANIKENTNQMKYTKAILPHKIIKKLLAFGVTFYKYTLLFNTTLMKEMQGFRCNIKHCKAC